MLRFGTQFQVSKVEFSNLDHCTFHSNIIKPRSHVYLNPLILVSRVWPGLVYSAAPVPATSALWHLASGDLVRGGGAGAASQPGIVPTLYPAATPQTVPRCTYLREPRTRRRPA